MDADGDGVADVNRKSANELVSLFRRCLFLCKTVCFALSEISVSCFRLDRNFGQLLLRVNGLLDFACDLLGCIEGEDNDNESNFHLLGSAAMDFCNGLLLNLSSDLATS